MSNLIEDIKLEEGYSGTIYRCTEGFDTVGYGTRMPITKEEAELLLEHRLKAMRAQLTSYLYDLDIKDEAWDILFNMAYQLGVNGVLKFKNMIKALKDNDYKEASIQMLDSLWAKQTPNRAKRLSDRMNKL